MFQILSAVGCWGLSAVCVHEDISGTTVPNFAKLSVHAFIVAVGCPPLVTLQHTMYFRFYMTVFPAVGQMTLCLQCFDAVGWATGMASGL